MFKSGAAQLSETAPMFTPLAKTVADTGSVTVRCAGGRAGQRSWRRRSPRRN